MHRDPDWRSARRLAAGSTTMVAPTYSAQRQTLAKQIGLGRKPAPLPLPAPEPEKPKAARRRPPDHQLVTSRRSGSIHHLPASSLPCALRQVEYGTSEEGTSCAICGVKSWQRAARSKRCLGISSAMAAGFSMRSNRHHLLSRRDLPARAMTALLCGVGFLSDIAGRLPEAGIV